MFIECMARSIRDGDHDLVRCLLRLESIVSVIDVEDKPEHPFKTIVVLSGAAEPAGTNISFEEFRSLGESR